MARLSAPAMVDRPPRSVSSFIPLKELIDLFRQLFAEHEHRAPVVDALHVAPHHLHDLRFSDLLPENWAIFAIAEGEDLLHHAALPRRIESGAQRIHAGQRRNDPRVGKFLYGFDLIVGEPTPCH